MTMTPRERFLKVLSFEKVDRIPLMDFGYWRETIALWHTQGLPQDVDTTEEVERYLGLDRGFETNLVNYWSDNGPVGFLWGLYPESPKRKIAETETTVTYESDDGITLEHKQSGSIPQHLRHLVQTMQDFQEKVVPRKKASDKGRITPEFFSMLEYSKATGQPCGVWLDGFLAWPRILTGIENLSYYYYDQPELIHAINRQHVEFMKEYIDITLTHTPLDYACFFEDMCYKGACLVSPAIFDEFMKPYYLEIVAYLRQHGVQKIMVDSDGYTGELCAKLIEVGADAHYPCEIAAGSHPQLLRSRYPNLALVGGIDKFQLSLGREAIDKELERLCPVLETGGFIPALDHRVPPNVSLDNYKYYLERKQRLLERYSG